MTSLDSEKKIIVFVSTPLLSIATLIVFIVISIWMQPN